jgi:hypothetical protein
METLHYRGALLAALCVLADASCGGRAWEPQDKEAATAGTEGYSCLPGDTRECVGKGACRGGQQCSAEGSWGACNCGTTGGTSSSAAGGSTGGQETGGVGALGTGLAGTSSTGMEAGAAGQASAGYGPTGGAGGTGGRGGRGGSGGGGGRSTRGGSSASGGGGVAGGSAAGGTSATGGVATGGVATGGVATGGVANRPPKITELTFYPTTTTVTTDDTIYVYPKATDPDSDPISFSYAWTCNGDDVGWNTAQLEGWQYFSKGDEIQVTVTPSDSKSSGAPMTSEVITIANAAPEFYSWPGVSPYPYAADDDTLTCSAYATDPDGDPLTYTYGWYQTGTLTSYDAAELPDTATSMGDYWSCEVTATDGDLSASTSSDSTGIFSMVSGIYRTDTTWQASQSPYMVEGRIQIAAGVTLTIEPGVTVLGNNNALESWGSVSMLGTSEHPILVQDLYLSDFSTADNPGKVTLSYVEYVRGSLLATTTAAWVEMTDSVVRSMSSPVSLPGGVSEAHRFERNLFFGTCGISSVGSLTLRDNTFASTYYYCSSLYFSNLEGSVVAASNSFYPSPYTTNETMVVAGATSVDLRESYWGGLSDEDLPARIYDNNDDLNIAGAVEYEPTATEPSADAPAVDKTYFPYP